METETKEFEKILNTSAKENMKEWSLEMFKKSHPSLFKTIIRSMQEVDKKASNRVSPQMSEAIDRLKHEIPSDVYESLKYIVDELR